MAGNAVFVGSPVPGRPLFWDLKNRNGRLVANGTYLVVAEVKSVSGRTHAYFARLGIKR